MSADGRPDEDLAARAKAGERACFEVLVRRHKEHLYGFLRRYVGHSDDAYDILQDCFVAAWLGLRGYDAQRPFLPWLRTIALNKARDFARRQKIRRMVLRMFAREPRPVFIEEHADGHSQTARLLRLDRAIAELPALYKEPLLLTVVSGLTHREVASLLKTTPKAIEMRLSRARRKLFTALRENK